MPQTDEDVFWELIEELQLEDPRVEEGTIMGGRCARVAGRRMTLRVGVPGRATPGKRCV